MYMWGGGMENGMVSSILHYKSDYQIV